MDKQTVEFATTTKNGIVTQIGRSTILQLKPRFVGGSVKWLEGDKLKINKTK